MCEDGSSMAIMLDHRSTAGFIGRRCLQEMYMLAGSLFYRVSHKYYFVLNIYLPVGNQ